MDRAQLEEIAAGGESERVEFKRTTGQRSAGMETVCGMLNAEGGWVLFGVSDNGDLRGQEVSDNTLQQLVGLLQKIEPPVLIQPQTVEVEDGREVIALDVPGARTGPFRYDGRPYIREGPTTQVMSTDRYPRLLREGEDPKNRWEVQPATGIEIDDLDEDEIRLTVEEAIRRGRLEDPGTRDPSELLRGLGVTADGTLLNAALALFGKKESLKRQYPQCLLRMARFRGTTTTEFEDNRQIRGNTFTLFKRAQSFLRDHVPVAGTVEPGLFEREDEPLYPMEALREALANALCHREYHISGGSVSIGIFDDRLEVTSTGRLPPGVSIEDLKKPHASQPRNPLIADVFFRRGLIEQWGRGTVRMTELTEEAGLAPPEFEERGGEFVVRFFPTGYVAPRRVDHALDDLQQMVLQTVAEYGPARLGTIRQKLGTEIERRRLQSTLQNLRSLDLVKLEGHGRGAYWSLPDR